VGHGECVMGIVDSYPHPWPPLPPSSCDAADVPGLCGAAR
jgi:hypothetical protein